MIGTIGHLGKVSLKKGIAVATLYMMGAIVGGAATGCLVSSLGYGFRWTLGIDTDPSFLIVGPLLSLLALAGGLRDFGIISFPLPQRTRQVPQAWMQVFGPGRTAVLWGLMIGTGCATFIRYSLLYVVFAWIFVMAAPARGAAIMACFGLGQGALLIAETAALAAPHQDPLGLLGLERWSRLSHMSGTALVAAGTWLLFGSLSLLYGVR